MEKLLVYNKKLKQIEEEKIYGSIFIDLFYGKGFLNQCISTLFGPLVTHFAILSCIYGKLQNRESSKRKIEPFIKKFDVDASVFQKGIHEFTSFNDFFIRKLKANARKWDADPSVLIAPCDGRFHVIENIDMETSFLLKGHRFDLKQLLLDDSLAKKYEGGSLVLARLCPTDYHRFHFPADGFCSASNKIDGKLYSVNPIAIKKVISTFWENKREFCLLKTTHFKDILIVEVGATYVGTIHQTYSPGEKVKKGDEKGYFSFGGSSLLLLLEKDTVVLDEELIEYSRRGLEVKLEMGDTIGNGKL